MLCPECKHYKTCSIPCDKLEAELKKAGCYSSSYIRKAKESPMDNQYLDDIATQRAFKLRYGRKPRLK